MIKILNPIFSLAFKNYQPFHAKRVSQTMLACVFQTETLKIIESKNNKPVITSEVNPAETASHISENTPAGNVSEDKASLLAEKNNNTASVAIKNNSQPVKENNIAAWQQEKNKESE